MFFNIVYMCMHVSPSVVQDLHEELEMRVYKVGRNDHFLGMVRIPLHRVSPHMCTHVCTCMCSE